MHVSMHVENEASGDTFLRHRSNTGDVSTLSKPSSGVLSDTKEYSKDDLMTPTNQRLNSDDSGYLSPRLNSDPDWYLRPRKLDTDTQPKKTYKTAKSSVLTQTRRMFFSNSRPNFVDSRSSKRWQLTTEAVLGGLLFAILVASIGFTALISVRFHESEQSNLNGKYKSMEYARQQRKNKDLGGKKDLEQKNPVESKDSQDGKTSSRLNKKDASGVITPEQHFPRELREGRGLVNYEQEAMPKLQDAKASKKIVPEELIRAPGGVRVGVEAVGDINVKALKRLKQRSKNTNPLTKSVKSPKMSSVKKQGPTPLDYDKDPSSFRGRLEPRENSEANDYDEDPSTFRGKQDPHEDNIDYEQDPSTFRGNKKEESNDYESDPSTFRGKKEHSMVV